MKKQLTISSLLLLCLSAFATIDVAYTSKSVSGENDAFELVAKNTVYNKSDVNDTLTWIRTKKEITGGWESAACDNVACWFPEIDSNQIVIEPGESSNLDIYFYPDGNEGKVDVEILLYRTSEGKQNGITLSYSGSSKTTTAINENLALSTLDIHPNPASSVIYLQEGEVEFYDIIGNLVLTAQSTGSLDISKLVSGIYFLVSNNRTARLTIE